MRDVQTEMRRPVPVAGDRVTEAIGALALAGLLTTAVVLAAGSAGTPLRYFLPSSRHARPDWLAGPLQGLGVTLMPRDAAQLIVLMFACYLVAVAAARALSPRVVWSAVIVAHVAMLLAPPIFSADVFGYISYARLFVAHGVDPYVQGANAVPADAARPFVVWTAIATPYGPLYMLASVPLGMVSVPVALWACKLLAAGGSLLCAVLVGRIAAARGRDPATAVAFFALNPLLLVWEVGGAHNDMLPVGLTLLAVLLLERGRPAVGGASAALAFGAKASAGLALPFALLAPARSGRRAAFAGAFAAVALVAAASLAAFGTSALTIGRQLRQQQDFVATNSVPSRLAQLLGWDHLPERLRLGLGIAFALTTALLLVAVWLRRIDWIEALGWATLALLLASAWLVPWYAVWLLPLAAVAGSRWLSGATLLFCAYVIATQVHWLVI